MIINFFGLPATGKSTLRNAIIGRIGKNNCSKIRGDHYLKSRNIHQSLEEYFSEDRMDWDLLKKHLNQPNGTVVYTPDMNWNTFRRIRLHGTKSCIIRDIKIIDSVHPCPFADYKVLLTLPNDIRKIRVTNRSREDSVWKTVTLENWDLQEDAKKNEKFKLYADLSLESHKAIDNLVDEVLKLVRLKNTGNLVNPIV